MEKLLRLGRGRSRKRDTNCGYAPLRNCDDNASSGSEEKQEGEEGRFCDKNVFTLYTY